TWRDAGGAGVNLLSHSYDANGNELTAADYRGAYTYTYDKLDPVRGAQDLFRLTPTSTHDAARNPTPPQDSTGGTTTTGYNAAGRLTSRLFGGAGLTPLRFDTSYTPRDQEEVVTRYSDLAGTTKVGETTYAYDDAGRTNRILHKSGSGAALVNFTYTYDL